MKTAIIIVALLIISIGSIMFFSHSNTKTSFMDEYKNTANAVLVDVRTPDEFAQGHITGAVNVDFYSPDFLDHMKALGTDKKFFIYCRSGSRSGQAKAELGNAGMWVTDLPGGISNHPELLN